MMTVKQVSSLTGVSVRALQFYDQIGLLKPADVTPAGYRLYDDRALETLQQILFFKELDFTLKEIKAILSSPNFDKAGAFAQQRELIALKRDRLNALLGLLDKLIKGERCMEFQEFDLSEYLRMLAEFKQTHSEQIVKQLGSVEKFDELISSIKANEAEIAALAVKQYGSVEAYSEAVRQNMERYYENGPNIQPEEVDGLMERTDALTRHLTSDISRDPASPEVQEAVRELISFIEQCNQGMDMGVNYWPFMAEQYGSNPAFRKDIDQKYGEGAAAFISQAIQAYTG